MKKYNPENQPKAWLFLLPSLGIILLFSVYPLFRSLWMSFQKGSLINQRYAGLENYQRVLNDPIFYKALKNTALYAFAVVPIALIISLAIAWIIFEKVKHKSFFETIFFMPYVTSTIAIGIVFRYFFNGDYGIVNYVLGFFGIPSVNWLDNVQMSMPTLIIFGVWTSLAFNIIILLAGLRNIDEEHFKIAKMFGASDGEIFRRITFPQLVPTIAFLLTVNLIGAFKVYTQVYALFGGRAGIANSATTAVYYIYDKFHIAGRPGIAMAATVILFVIILVVTFLQNKLLKKVGNKPMKKVLTIIAFVFLGILAVITLFPFVYMILAGLMSYSEATSMPPTMFPKQPQWQNYTEVFQKAPFLRYFLNTVFVSGVTTIATVVTAVLASFALTSLKFRFKNVVIALMISLLMVPYESIIFTNYQTIAQLGLLNTYSALIIPFLTSIFYIYYLNGYLKGIPDTFYKAAKIDGASDLEYIWRILVPMSKPALVTVGILTFISSWNSFLWPLLVTNEKKYRLLNNGLSAFATESGSDVHLQMAAATLTVIPILIIYLIFRKEIIRGVAKNGIKG